VDQEFVRERVRAAHERGVAYSHIAKQCGMSRQHFAHFMGGRGLYAENLERVVRWLKREGHWEEGAALEPRKGDPWALPVTRLSALLDTLRDPALPDNEKARAFSFEIGYLSSIIKAALKETGHEVP
jgi:hypothetical protein